VAACAVLDQNEPKNQGFVIKLKRKFSHATNFLLHALYFKRLPAVLLSRSENVILASLHPSEVSVIYFTSVA
jgi:regulator of extracellular matrix RemA (YlzA/DUF370 family)